MATQPDIIRLYTTTDLSEELGMTPQVIPLYEAKRLLEPQRLGQNRVST